nr:bifunctional homocysteine S-methyltransferase/methylenetetrahydrofolate reductase [Bacilli bacterium]
MGDRVALASYLQDHLLVGDGAMATQLYQLGLPVGVCYEEFNVSRPDVVRSVHRSYYEAGARLIETNTFSAHVLGLSRYGLEDQLEAINLAGVSIAREAVGDDAYVVATIGSLQGVRKTTIGSFDRQSAYERQLNALLAGQPDGLLFETFLDLEELLCVVTLARTLTTIPIIAQLSLIDLGVTRDGVPLDQAFQQLRQVGATVVGLNCRYGPADLYKAFAKTPIDPDLMLSVYPNAGLLSVTDGDYTYASRPEYFGKMADEFRALGVRIIGGCCGTTPDHVRAMAKALEGLAPVEIVHRVMPKAESFDHALSYAALDADEKAGSDYPTSYLHDKAKHTSTVIVELDPPKDLSVAKFLLGAKALRDAGADAVTLADNSLAVTRMSNLALGALMKREGIEPLLHISCRDRNLIGQQSHLMGLHALDIHQILVITGDPSRFGDLPGATSVFDVSSFDMIRMVKDLNQGKAFSGQTLKQKTRFSIGAAFNPNVAQFDKAITRLEKKIATGADYIMTQPIYNPAVFAKLAKATAHLSVPIFVGIMPLLSHRNAEFLHNEVPGITLSEDARKRMANYEGERARAEGVAIAKELIDVAVDYFHGIYLITPMLRYEMTVELTRYVKEKVALHRG